MLRTAPAHPPWATVPTLRQRFPLWTLAISLVALVFWGWLVFGVEHSTGLPMSDPYQLTIVNDGPTGVTVFRCEDSCAVASTRYWKRLAPGESGTLPADPRGDELGVSDIAGRRLDGCLVTRSGLGGEPPLATRVDVSGLVPCSGAAGTGIVLGPDEARAHSEPLMPITPTG